MTQIDPEAIVIDVKLTLTQVNIILEALSNMPFKVVETLLNGMRHQAISAVRDAGIKLADVPAGTVPQTGQPESNG